MTATTPQPGAHIIWTHYTRSGRAFLRSGRIGDRGPAVAGASVVWWVVPDRLADGDLYDRVAVGKRAGGPPGVRGTLFSDDDPASPLGRLAVEAAESARRARAGRWVRAEGGAS